MKCGGLCHAYKTQNHILQQCEATHATRCARNNGVMHLESRKLKRDGKKICTEPIIPTNTSFIKPNLIMGAGKHADHNGYFNSKGPEDETDLEP